MTSRKKTKRTTHDLQNNTHKTKDQVTRTPLKTGGELRCTGMVSSSCSTSGTRRVIFSMKNIYASYHISFDFSSRQNVVVFFSTCVLHVWLVLTYVIYYTCMILEHLSPVTNILLVNCTWSINVLHAEYNTTGATSGAGTAYHSGAPEFTPSF
jgi:hypothetical protein